MVSGIVGASKVSVIQHLMRAPLSSLVLPCPPLSSLVPYTGSTLLQALYERVRYRKPLGAQELSLWGQFRGGICVLFEGTVNGRANTLLRALCVIFVFI